MTEHLEYAEALIARRPVTVRRRVLWAECDPARIVYTGRFFDYISAAYHWFLRTVLNEGEPLASFGLSTPIKAVTLEFHHVLRPDDWFEMVVRVSEIRTRTFDVEIAAKLNENLAFTGRISPIFVDDATKVSCPIPEVFRNKLEVYRSATLSVAK